MRSVDVAPYRGALGDRVLPTMKRLRALSEFMLNVARAEGEILVLVPMTECTITGPVVESGKVRIERAEWRGGPIGHRVRGTCTTGCHVVVQYPRVWRTRGHAIANCISDPPSDLVDPLDTEVP